MTGNLLMAGVIILNIVSVFVSALFELPFFWEGLMTVSLLKTFTKNSLPSVRKSVYCYNTAVKAKEKESNLMKSTYYWAL
jgi:hypothetical protein